MIKLINRTGFIFFCVIFFPAICISQTKLAIVEGKGAPIVLLNGGTFDMTSFSSHSKLLSDSFTVIRLEQYNIQYANEGRQLPVDYSVNMESRAILNTLDSLGITTPIVIVGHSYGGVIAFDFSMRNPERVRALVLIEAPLFDIAKVNNKHTRQMQEIDDLTREFKPGANITEEMIRRFRCKMSNCDTFDIRQHPMWPRWVKNKDRLRGLSVVPDYKMDFKAMKKFRKPVMIITGTTTLEANKIIDKLLSGNFRDAKSFTLDGDHITVYQQPGKFAEILKKFIREW